MWRSVPQMPVRRTRIRTSLMPIFGSGTSSSQRPGSLLLLTSARIFGPDIGDGVVSQQPAATADALGDPINKSLAELQDFGLAEKIFLPGGREKARLHLGRHCRLLHSEPGHDGEPHGDVGRGHEYLPADEAARPFESGLERH